MKYSMKFSSYSTLSVQIFANFAQIREMKVFFFLVKFSIILGPFDFCLIQYLVCFAKICVRRL